MASEDDALSEFGLPAQLPRRVAEQMVDALVRLWQIAHDQSPGALRPDLAAHHSYFDPVAQGRRLREAFLSLEPAEHSSAVLTTPMFLQVDGQRFLITPEGRIALALLQQALSQQGTEVVLDTAAARSYERELLALYREWGRHRQRQVIDLMGGGRSPLQLPAIGAALTLLVNRSDSAERAITRFPKGERAAQNVDHAFFACAEAFANALGSADRAAKRKTTQKEGLISGWTLGEVRRRLPDALVLTKSAVHVAANQQGPLMDLLVAELRRRKGASIGGFEDAFDALLEAFRAQSEVLAGYGLLFERPSYTAQLREDLMRRWRHGE
jgi:hypothetical protein